MSRVPSADGEDLGQLGLADAGLALEQQRATQPQAQEDGGDESAIGDVVVLGERGLQAVDGLGVVGHTTDSSVPASLLWFASVTSESEPRQAVHGRATPRPPEPDEPREPEPRRRIQLTEPSRTPSCPIGDRLDEIAQDRFGRTDWIELAAAVLLALATIVAAWSAYQATRWGGEQAKASSECAVSQDRRCPADDHLRCLRPRSTSSSGRCGCQQRADENDVACRLRSRSASGMSSRQPSTPGSRSSPDGEPPPGHALRHGRVRAGSAR